jgi:predicted PurR-regulated permease PerM
MQQKADTPAPAESHRPQGEGDPAQAQEDAARAVEAAASRVWVRSAVLSAMLFLLVMYTLYLAASLLIPITLAFLLSVVLSPLVRMLGRLYVPQFLSALLVMLAFATFLVAIAYAIAQPALSWMERAPSELQELEYKLAWVKEPIAELEKARRQVNQIADVADVGEAGEEQEQAPPQRPQPAFSLVDSVLLATPMVAFGFAVTVILLFFMLASGDALLNKAVQVSPTLTDKRRVVETGRGIQQHVSTYLGTITVINAAVGVLVGTAMYLLDVPNPVLWGVMVGVLNYIPYLGVGISIVVVTFVGLLTFDEPLQVVLPPLAIFAINVVEGQFLTPIIAGRQLALSPVAVFLSLVVMGWVWGIFGVLMAVPLLAIVKLVCEEVEQLHWVATFLGDD